MWTKCTPILAQGWSRDSALMLCSVTGTTKGVSLSPSAHQLQNFTSSALTQSYRSSCPASRQGLDSVHDSDPQTQSPAAAADPPPQLDPGINAMCLQGGDFSGMGQTWKGWFWHGKGIPTFILCEILPFNEQLLPAGPLHTAWAHPGSSRWDQGSFNSCHLETGRLQIILWRRISFSNTQQSSDWWQSKSPSELWESRYFSFQLSSGHLHRSGGQLSFPQVSGRCNRGFQKRSWPWKYLLYLQGTWSYRGLPTADVIES